MFSRYTGQTVAVKGREAYDRTKMYPMQQRIFDRACDIGLLYLFSMRKKASAPKRRVVHAAKQKKKTGTVGLLARMLGLFRTNASIRARIFPHCTANSAALRPFARVRWEFLKNSAETSDMCGFGFRIGGLPLRYLPNLHNYWSLNRLLFLWLRKPGEFCTMRFGLL